MAVKSLTKAIRIPRPIQNAKTPRDMTRPRRKHLFRFSAAWDKLMILIGISGRTQGVKFSSKPPKAAVSSSTIHPNPDDVLMENCHPKRSKRTTPADDAIAPAKKLANSSVFIFDMVAPGSTTESVSFNRFFCGNRQYVSEHAWYSTRNSSSMMPGFICSSNFIGR